MSNISINNSYHQSPPNVTETWGHHKSYGYQEKKKKWMWPVSRWSQAMAILSHSPIELGWGRPAQSRDRSAPNGRVPQPQPPLSGRHQIHPEKKNQQRWPKRTSIAEKLAIRLLWRLLRMWHIQELSTPNLTRPLKFCVEDTDYICLHQYLIKSLLSLLLTFQVVMGVRCQVEGAQWARQY